MTDTLDLPPLQESMLDAATLDQLFVDIAQRTELIEVIIKSGRRAEETPGKSYTLEDDRTLLTQGEARGVQLRYRYEETQWWDTLMRTPQGVRLGRIRHDFQAPQASADQG